MKSHVLQLLLRQVDELTGRKQLDAIDDLPTECRHMLPSRRLLKIDRYIIVAAHDHLDTDAGETWDRYRRSLNL